MPQNAQNRVNNNRQDRLLTMDPLRCAHLNTHHCKAAVAHLSLYTSKNKVDVLFIQEPYCYNWEPCYIPADNLSFHASSDTHPRAALLIIIIIIINFMLLHQFSNLDNVIVVTSTNPQIHIASSYLPSYDTLEQDLAPIGYFLKTVKPINFIWGLDANSKHSIWYNPTIDEGQNTGRFIIIAWTDQSK